VFTALVVTGKIKQSTVNTGYISIYTYPSYYGQPSRQPSTFLQLSLEGLSDCLGIGFFGAGAGGGFCVALGFFSTLGLGGVGAFASGAIASDTIASGFCSGS